MPTTKPQTRKTPERSLSLENDAAEFAPEVLPRSSSSSLTELYSSPEFSLSWDNDVKHHVARNMLHLRRYRDEKQADVAEAMGTSQSAVARMEAGEENFKANTLERWIAALKGRFFVAVLPEEFPFLRPMPWWENDAIPDTGWSLRFVVVNEDRDLALIGMERTKMSLVSQGATT